MSEKSELLQELNAVKSLLRLKQQEMTANDSEALANSVAELEERRQRLEEKLATLA